jgi:hypothetical protein
VTDDQRVSVCRAWLTYRPAEDTAPGARVQVYDGGVGRLAEEGVIIRDGAMEPVVRGVDLQRAFEQLGDPLLLAAGTWWRTRSFEEFQARRRREDGPLSDEERWALAFGSTMQAICPVEWSVWEEMHGVLQDRDPQGHFRRRGRDDLAQRILAAARAAREAAARAMAVWLGDGW